ncbi:MAG: PAS domain-containing protein [Pseudolabrys sp.]|nr:PAS domain-containing protein [Pseudolabrys sp.]MCW5685740.1 PAS domain-containing protein [Pseudolabrys sp.]
MGTQQPTLDYVESLCGDLSRLAKRSGYELLAYLLEVALLEAKQQQNAQESPRQQNLDCDEIGLWVWDMRSDLCIADRYAAELYGLKENAAAPGLPVERYFECIHPDDRDFARQRIHEAMQSGTLQMDYRVLRPDGSIKKIRTRGLVTFDNEGNPTSIAGTDADISGCDDALLSRRLTDSYRPAGV